MRTTKATHGDVATLQHIYSPSSISCTLPQIQNKPHIHAISCPRTVAHSLRTPSLKRPLRLERSPAAALTPFSCPSIELGLSTCNSAGKSWCDLGISVGVGGGLGFIGVIMICGGLIKISVEQKERGCPTVQNVLVIVMGVLWCLSWSSAVVVWGGVDGATYVGIMWGLPIMLTVTVLYCAYSCRRRKDEQ